MGLSKPKVWIGIVAFTAGLALLFAGARAARDAQGLAAFAQMATVFQHARCMNCHRSDLVRVRDDARAHIPRVLPGEDGAGVGGMQCVICHRDENNEMTRIPGAPGWRMPPYLMSLDGLDPADICDNLKDRDINGDRSLKEVIAHLKHDHLVRWSWSPGKGRSPPPISYSAFLRYANAWADADAPCPPAG
ncbi:MAG: hypothetical protein AAFO62_13225 [Pseudomonadota bacterium]